MAIKTIILAAGQGTRMRSALPKVMHKIGGKPLLRHVYDLAREIPDNRIMIVHGHGGDTLRSNLPELDVDWVEQNQQLGTGHAVIQAAPMVHDKDTVLILYGDVPLLEKSTVDRLLDSVNGSQLGLLTVNLERPDGYGRILRDSAGNIRQIVEEKDADAAQKRVREVNSGILAADGGRLKQWLAKLSNDNVQGEYYLTDVIAMAVSEGVTVGSIQPETADEVLGVNDRKQLAHLERVYQFNRAANLMERGVTLADPRRFDLRGEILEVGQDIEIDVNVVLEGQVSIGDRVMIGPNSTIRNSSIADDVEILANCVIEDARIEKKCRIGPFARLRPETNLAASVHIGNFVEIKKSEIAAHSKINHLSYIGDSSIGSNVNIGAGTITCNYDGANKFRTIIEDDVFIGSDTQLVAPVRVSKNATVGAGSTITSDAPENSLTLSRSKQRSVKGWRRPKKKPI